MPIRPIRPSDFDALNRLHRQVGWPERSQAGWRWLDENPARLFSGAPSGWVVADEADAPVAMLGNFVQRFHHGPRILHGATGFSIIVPPEHKGASRGLINTFVKQQGMFARYTLNANARSAPLYPKFGMTPFPVETASVKLSWIVDKLACAKGRMLRKLFGGLSASAATRLGEQLMNRRLFRPEPLKLAADIAPLRDLSDRSEYADFWRDLVAEGHLLADRSPAMMRWRMSDPDQTVRPLLLGLRRNGRIVGVAMASMGKNNLIEPPCLDILDLAALKSAPEAIEVLAAALVANARGMGAAKVRLQVVTPELLESLGALAATARREGGWGHGHAVIDEPELASAWAPTPFDGDYAICNRPTPLSARKRRAQAQATPQGRLSKA